MQKFRLTESYYVAPQIEVADIVKIANAGFVKIICNRPDEEVPIYLKSKFMKAAAVEVGIEFEILPLTKTAITKENILKQFEMVSKANGPVLAYCTSGMRSTILWALSQARTRTVEDIVCTAKSAGFDLGFIRENLN